MTPGYNYANVNVKSNDFNAILVYVKVLCGDMVIFIAIV